MLLQFSLENFMSFKNKETFSLVASDLTELPDNKFQVIEDLSLLKTASIYGANASGKSNLLVAMSFMKGFIHNSFKSSQEGEKISVNPFRLNHNNITKPICLEIAFITEDIFFKYGFEVTEVEVVKEWLYADEELVFLRENGSIVIGECLKDEKTQIKWEMTRNNSLFISVLASTNTNIAKIVVKYFANSINIISGLKGNTSNFTKNLIEEHPSIKKKILNLLKDVDFAITNLSVDKINIHEDEIPLEVREFIEIDSSEIKTTHNIYNDKGEITGKTDFVASQLESSGTNQFLAISGPIIDTLENGYTLLIDEMDAQFHPLMSKFLIEVFNSTEINKKNAQLIFTTHNVTNLSNELFRRDQIWFIEKDLVESSHLTALVEYKFNAKRVRSDERYGKNYLNGKYGAIPLIQLEKDFIEEHFRIEELESINLKESSSDEN